MKVGFLITGRMKSTRLPKKLTKKIFGREIIRWMIDRLKLNNLIDEIIICTSTNPQDDVLEQIAIEEGIKVFRGSEDDVIQRLYDASVLYELDYALNITADCPLVSLEYISKIIEAYKFNNADFIRTLDLPHGFFSYGISIEAMKKVCEIKKGIDTEVWGRYFTDSGMFKVEDLIIPKEIIRSEYRLTLDYPEDFDFFTKLFENFGSDTISKNIHEIVGYLDNHPDIVAINQDCKAKYQQRWETQNKLEL
jgi:spore coat polysaccharide biosynthesis protein SpsF